jgi:hypothetical protein
MLSKGSVADHCKKFRCSVSCPTSLHKIYRQIIALGLPAYWVAFVSRSLRRKHPHHISADVAVSPDRSRIPAHVVVVVEIFAQTVPFVGSSPQVAQIATPKPAVRRLRWITRQVIASYLIPCDWIRSFTGTGIAVLPVEGAVILNGLSSAFAKSGALI